MKEDPSKSQQSVASLSEQATHPLFLSGGGECGALIRSTDWSKTAVGPIESWPQSLRTLLGVMLDNKFGMYIGWGKEFTQFYNDGYRPILGSTKHPAAMGNTTDQTFAESWHIIGPLFENVMKGESVGSEDWLLPLDRHGYLEDCYFTFSYSPIRIESGEVGGVLVTVTETTNVVKTRLEQEKLLGQIESARQDLHGFFMQAPVPMVILEGPNHLVSLANPPYQRFVGRPVVGKTIAEAFPDGEADYYIPILDKVYQSGTPYIGKELPLQLPDEAGVLKGLWINIVYHPFRDAQDKIKGVLALVLDVTDQVNARQKIQESNEVQKTAIEQLITEKRLREQFVSTLSHDLQSPLTAAKLGAQMLGRNAGVPDKIASLSGRIIDSLNRASQMIENLLDANRIKAGEKLELELSKTGLFSIVSETLEELTTIHGDRFSIDAPEKIINGVWSEEALRRMVENLCSNAVKYGSDRFPITVKLRKLPDAVTIGVHNRGNPIPAAEVPYLFDPYKRATTAHSGSTRGWGLGLTLVKGLAEAQNGHLKVESDPNEGTTFTIYLPLDSSAEAASKV